jgi:hypothetical protein
LRKEFDNVAGEGRYDEIFASEKDPVTGEWVDKVGDADKIDALQDILEQKYDSNPEKINQIQKDVDNIIKRGRYEIR